MEKLLFAKIEMWILLLVLVAGSALLIIYGSLVRHVANGGTSAGALGTAAFALASIPSQAKEIFEEPKEPRDFMTKLDSATIASTFDLSSYKPISNELDKSLDRVPVFWADQSHGPFQPAAMMFRFNDDATEQLIILDHARQMVRHFPVTAGSLSGKYPPLMGNSSARMLDDGTYIVHSLGSEGLYRKSLCGEEIWSAPGLFHHTYSIADGKLGILGLPKEDITNDEQAHWFSSDIINIIDLETGAIDRSVPLGDIVRANIGTIDPFQSVSWHNLVNENGVLTEDFVHLNKIEILSEELAGEYPDFPAGAWMLSSRYLNMIFIVDPSNLKILWHSQGNTQRQHDPDFVGENRIIVFNNAFHKNRAEIPEDPANFSSIRAFDFGSGLWNEVYNGASVEGYTAHNGEVASGQHGRLLINMTVQGRYLEVSNSGEVISEFINVRDPGSVYWTKSAQYISENQFKTAKDIECR